MLSEPRITALLTELIHVPTQHSGNKLRNLYTQLCSQCDFENFTRTPSGARIERPASGERGRSLVIFTGDRIRFVEEGGLLTLKEFSFRLETLLGEAIGKLGIPLFLMQQCTARVIVSPGAFQSASDFINSRLVNISPDDLSEIGRQTHVFGLRLTVPPAGQQHESYNLRVEVYAREPKSLYLENVGTFRTPIQRNDLNSASRAMGATVEFLSDRLCPFLSQLDVGPGREE